MSKILWHSLPEKEIFELLKTNKNGLSSFEAERRIKKFGLNKLAEAKRVPWFLILVSQFKSSLIYILLIAALISFLLKEYIDMWVILAAVIINTIVGFIQEYKAERTLEYLKKIITFKSKIIRDGIEIRIDSSKITRGDIIVLEAGDRIPADGRLFMTNDFQVNESSLTGESVPVSKELGILPKGVNLAERKNMVFMGTTVTRGRALAIITEIGNKTELGEIAKLVKETKKEQTPLQLKLTEFSKMLGLVVLISSLFIFLFGIISGREAFIMFETSVAIAVAAIPEGLLVAVTVILTVGMQRILAEKALVRKLVATETLGSTSVICTDKTGTLTEGVMRLAYLLTGCCDFEKDLIHIGKRKINGEVADHLFLLTIGTICNNALISSTKEGLEEFIGDSTETALLKASIEVGLDYEELRQKYERLAEIPFSTEIKYMATLNNYNNDNNIVYLKGAPEKILNFSSFVQINGKKKKLGADLRRTLLKNFDKLTSQGLRILAAGYKLTDKGKNFLTENDLNKFIFLGVFALKDPLRLEAKEAIHLCKMAGIHPVIVTGDHPLTARTIAQEVGLSVDGSHIIKGDELDKLSDDELKKKVKEINIYARVSPKHKLRIIDAWQTNGEVVAMIGDGINDAPALKSADIGVALGSGTDVAKETSEIILLDNNFKTIVSAVREGRIIFDNVRKSITYLLADSFSEMILIFLSLIFSLPLPITALQILYVNLVADTLPNLSLTKEPGEKDIMKLKPRPKKEPILNNQMKLIIFLIGIATDIGLFLFFLYLLKINYDLEHIRTIIFMALGIDSLIYIFSCKSLRHTIFQYNPFSNRYLISAIIIGFLLMIITLYVPFLNNALKLSLLSKFDWLIIGSMAILKLLAIESGKYVFIQKGKWRTT